MSVLERRHLRKKLILMTPENTFHLRWLLLFMSEEKSSLSTLDKTYKYISFVLVGQISSHIDSICGHSSRYPVSILYKSISGRYRPVRVADGPIRPAID